MGPQHNSRGHVVDGNDLMAKPGRKESGRGQKCHGPRITRTIAD